MMPAPRPMLLVWAASQARHRRGVGAVGLGDPCLRVAEALGLQDEGDVSSPSPIPAYPHVIPSRMAPTVATGPRP